LKFISENSLSLAFDTVLSDRSGEALLTSTKPGQAN